MVESWTSTVRPPRSRLGGAGSVARSGTGLVAEIDISGAGAGQTARPLQPGALPGCRSNTAAPGTPALGAEGNHCRRPERAPVSRDRRRPLAVTRHDSRVLADRARSRPRSLGGGHQMRAAPPDGLRFSGGSATASMMGGGPFFLATTPTAGGHAGLSLPAGAMALRLIPPPFCRNFSRGHGQLAPMDDFHAANPRAIMIKRMPPSTRVPWLDGSASRRRWDRRASDEGPAGGPRSIRAGCAMVAVAPRSGLAGSRSGT